MTDPLESMIASALDDAGQARSPNVIALQGRAAVEFFADLLRGRSA